MRLPRLVIASRNPGKVAEFRRLLAPVADQIADLGELGVEAAPEPHHTFVENALSKARHACAATGSAAIADDSGICVDALGGAPGVRSARFAGDAGDGANNDLLLEKMAGQKGRAAHYHCSLVLMRSEDDPAPIVVEGRWDGEIATSPRGEGGFGYDPLFAIGDGRTAAEIGPGEKDAVSHRAKALRSLLAAVGAAG